MLQKDLQEKSTLMTEQSKVILECARITLTIGRAFIAM